MKNKKVLWITDDQIDHADLHINIFKRFNLDLTLTEKFYYKKDFDLVLVDYGNLGNYENAVEILREYYLQNIPILWTGGLGGSYRYENDCKKMFPKEKWLHKVESWELRDIHFFVSRKLGVNPCDLEREQL